MEGETAVRVGAVTTTAGGILSVPYMMGFAATGVVKGSMAAGIQAVIGNVAGGSIFAAAQSVAATTALGTAAPLVIVGAGVGLTAYGAKKMYDRHN